VRRGATLPELMIVVLLITVLCSLVFPLVHRARDRSAAFSAAVEVRSLLAKARHLAVARRATTAVRFGTDHSVTVFTGRDTLVRRDLAGTHGVTLAASRDSIAYGPTGRGYGAANSTIIVRRGQAADTVVVSRLGRVRRR
jgi:Tfp pilus assembly protein FimT